MSSVHYARRQTDSDCNNADIMLHKTILYMCMCMKSAVAHTSAHDALLYLYSSVGPPRGSVPQDTVSPSQQLVSVTDSKALEELSHCTMDRHLKGQACSGSL